MKKRILITGADGFIGAALTQFLLKKKFHIKAMVLYNAHNSIGLLKYIKKNKNLEIIKGDIRDFSLLDKQCNDIDTIVNLAALIGIPYSYNATLSYINTNIIGTFNILEIIKYKNIKQGIFLSTSEVYGNAQYTPIDEKHPINPMSPYAATKVGADALINSYIKSFDLPITILRPFNTYGPRQSLRAVIPTIITQAIKKNTIKIGSIDTFRDFNYIDDTINGIFFSIGNRKTLHKTINIGSGHTHTIKEIIDIIGNIANKRLRITIEKKRKRPDKSEVKKLLASNKYAEKIIGYRPKTNIEKGLYKTYQWYKKHITSLYTDDYIV